MNEIEQRLDKLEKKVGEIEKKVEMLLSMLMNDYWEEWEEEDELN